jgi:hypothetical protein
MALPSNIKALVEQLNNELNNLERELSKLLNWLEKESTYFPTILSQFNSLLPLTIMLCLQKILKDEFKKQFSILLLIKTYLTKIFKKQEKIYLNN